MPCTSPNKSTEEITAVHFVCIQPVDKVDLGGCLHPNHHEMLSSARDPGIFFEDPNIMECIHFDEAHPHRKFYSRTHIVEMIELPFSPDSKESGCPLHKHVEDPKKATSPSSSEPKSEEKLETANDVGGENIASNGDANNLSPSKDPDDVGMMYTYTVEYKWSPMLKYCTMEEMGYKPLQLL